jgi:hypothetical protein
VKISPDEWPQRSTVWSADNARAVIGPLCAAVVSNFCGSGTFCAYTNHMFERLSKVEYQHKSF